MILNFKIGATVCLALFPVVVSSSPTPPINPGQKRQYDHSHNAHTDVVEDNVVVVYETVAVTGPISLSNAPTATAFAISAPSSEASDSDSDSDSSESSEPPTSSSSVSGISAPSSATSSATSSASEASSPTGSSGFRGIAYSPYKVGGCKTADEVKSDIAALANYDLVRIYGVDCDQVSNVLAALSPGQKVFLGVYDMSAIESALSTINSAVSSYGWGVVDTISIGNELVNNGAATVDQMALYVSTARSILSGYGYQGSIVTVDTYIAVINNPGLCALSDYVAVNAHPYFDSNCDASNAGSWVSTQISNVSKACASVGVNKEVIVTESGWPTQGNSNGAAVPSKSNQQSAVSALQASVGTSCIAFSAFNEYWKDPGSYGVEQYWGLY